MAEKAIVITGEHVIYHFRPDMEPKWHVKSGDLIEVHPPPDMHSEIQTEDDVFDEIDIENVKNSHNAAVGPIHIENAQPGDTLSFNILDLQLVNDKGYVRLFPVFGLLQDHVTQPRTKIVKIDSDIVQFNDLRIPSRPLIGTIGVAPVEGVWSTVYQHDFGGNMDCTDVTRGACIYFPVSVEGALLAMGDTKAIMGDGEVNGTGVSMPVIVTGRVEVIKQSIVRPLIETNDEWMTVASANTLEEACKNCEFGHDHSSCTGS